MVACPDGISASRSVQTINRLTGCVRSVIGNATVKRNETHLKRKVTHQKREEKKQIQKEKEEARECALSFL